MIVTLILLWAIVGYCGTVPNPLTEPDPPLPLRPRPCLVCNRVVGVLAGIAGGWIFSQVFLPQDPIPTRSALYAATTSVGAFVLARVASDIHSQFFGSRPGANPNAERG